MSPALLDAPSSLFDAAAAEPRFRRPKVTLEERLERAWRLAQSQGAADCPVCGSAMSPEGVSARCGGCGSVLS